MQQQAQNDDNTDLFAYGLLALGAVTASTYAGAWLASRLQAPREFTPAFGEALTAAIHLPENRGDPRLAWPEQYQASLPGPVGYWTMTGLVFVFAVTLGVLYATRKWRKETLDHRQRFGIDTQARSATRKDLRHLLLRTPDPHRMIIGRYRRRWVSVEAERQTGRRNRRSSGRGAIAHIGPSQSGKTTNVIDGVQHFGGPMILLSVKDDALIDTLPARRPLGEVKTFDPTGVTGRGDAHWSPLRSTATPHGALKAAKRLAATAPRTTASTTADFWNTQAESLVTALMLLAANGQDHTINDVVRWVITRDMPVENDQGEIAPLIRAMQSSRDAEVKQAANFARDLLQGIWKGDERTTSSIYATARAMLWAWTDPIVAEVSKTTDVDLAWLLDGNNTLYLSTPPTDHERVVPVLAGLLSDLVDQLFAHNVSTREPLNPPLLIVIDEAANLKLQDLPEWAATLSGLGVQLVTVWQSVVQIKAVYGDQAGAILTNHPTKLLYPGMSDLEGLEMISGLAGREHLPGRLGESHIRAEYASPTQVEFAPAAMIRRLRPGDALLIHATLPPAVIDVSRRQRPEPHDPAPTTGERSVHRTEPMTLSAMAAQARRDREAAAQPPSRRRSASISRRITFRKRFVD